MTTQSIMAIAALDAQGNGNGKPVALAADEALAEVRASLIAQGAFAGLVEPKFEDYPDEYCEEPGYYESLYPFLF